MNKQYLLLLDNSFRELYCYYKDQKELESICKRWDQVIASIEAKLPGFSNNYYFIDIPMCLFESIKGHNLLPTGKEVNKCFPAISSLFIRYDKANFENLSTDMVKLLDEKIASAFQNLMEFYNVNLSPIILIDLINEKTQKDMLHPNVDALGAYMSSCRKDLINNGKNSQIFQQLCRDLSWHSLTRHAQWFEMANDSNHRITKDDYERVYEIHFTKRLIAYYLNNFKENDYLAGSPLFIKYSRLEKARRPSGHYEEKDETLRVYNERARLDPYLTEYACMGFCDGKDNQRKKVIVLTCDLKQHIEQVTSYVDGRKRINAECEELEIIEQDFMPGHIIMIDNVTHTVFDIINIASYL